MTIVNAVRAGSAGATYSIEIASDSGFANKAYSKDGIAEGSGGTTAITVGALDGGTTYYWRTAATVDGTKGEMSPARTFVVRPNIVFAQPTNPSPAANGTASDPRPIFSVSNATHTGPAGSVFYEFEVGAGTDFSNIVAKSGPIAEQSNGTTSWASNVDLPEGGYVWHVRATDPTNDVQGPYSDAATFTLVPFDMRQARIWDNPADLGSWAETASITRVDLSSGRIVVDFDKRQGAGQWPDVGFGGGALQYTLGICGKIGGQWNCSAVVQFWNGRELEAGGDVGNMSGQWFYDNRWGAMMGWQPRCGETVGWFVAAGNLRDIGNVITKERSKVLMLPYCASYSR